MNQAEIDADVQVVIDERIARLRKLNPNHDLLRWAEPDRFATEAFLNRFGQRPAEKEGQAAPAIRLHGAVGEYSRALAGAIRTPTK